MPLVGGTKPVEDATLEVHELCQQVKAEVESKMGRQFSEFTAKKMTTQVVAGTNYFVKVHVGSEEYIHIRMHKNLQQKLKLTSFEEGKQKDDELKYF